MLTDCKQLEDELKAKNYQYLGWANGWKTENFEKDGQTYFRYVNQPELTKCESKGHNLYRNEEHYESVQHTNSGSNVTYYCDYCKIWWKVDMS